MFHVYIGNNRFFNTAEIILFYYSPVVQLFNPCDFSKRVALHIYFLLSKKKILVVNLAGGKHDSCSK